MVFRMIIPTPKANAEISKYLSFKEEAKENNSFIPLSTGARTFYESEEISFVFKKDDLDGLFQRLEDEEITPNAFRVYYGVNEDTNEPTLVVVPCNITDDGNHVTNLIFSEEESADEYPTKFTTAMNRFTFDLAQDNV